MPTGGGGSTAGVGPTGTQSSGASGGASNSIFGGYGAGTPQYGTANSNYGGVGYNMAQSQQPSSPANGYITSLYGNMLGRNPDSSGLSYWNNAYNNGASPGQIQQGFAQSPEYTQDPSGQALAQGQPQSSMFGAPQGQLGSQGLGTKSGSPMMGGGQGASMFGGYNGFANPYAVAGSQMSPYSNYATQSPQYPAQNAIFSPFNGYDGGYNQAYGGTLPTTRAPAGGGATQANPSLDTTNTPQANANNIDAANARVAAAMRAGMTTSSALNYNAANLANLQNESPEMLANYRAAQAAATNYTPFQLANGVSSSPFTTPYYNGG